MLQKIGEAALSLQAKQVDFEILRWMYIISVCEFENAFKKSSLQLLMIYWCLKLFE